MQLYSILNITSKVTANGTWQLTAFKIFNISHLAKSKQSRVDKKALKFQTHMNS